MKSLKILTSALFITLALFIFSTPTHASEGTAELKSTTDNQTRCFVTSIRTQDFNFKVVVSCRDLVYPTDQGGFAYILWATPKAGGSPLKLGALGLGKAIFKSKKAFTQLYVTSERDAKVKKPSNNIVAKGIIKPIDILVTKNPTPFQEEPAEDFGEIVDQPAPIIIEPQAGNDQGFFSGARRNSIIAIIGIFIIIIILAFITRSKS